MINIRFKSIKDLITAFPDENTCVRYLEAVRWADGITSPFDENSRVYVCANGRYRCKNTRKYFNVKTATLFDNTKISLQTWFIAIYLLTEHKKGISSVQLGKDLNLTQKTAWFMSQRIRACFGVEPEGSGLLGSNGEHVSADETFVGGKNKNRHKSKKVEASQGRSFKDKTPVIGLLQHNGERPATVRCIVATDTRSETIQPVVRGNVSTAATFITDEWPAYAGLSGSYNHQVVDHRIKQYVNAEGYTTNPIEGFWSIFKRAYVGIYHRMSRKHLQRYANEVAFRYNSRHLDAPGRFKLLIANSNKTTYKALIA